MIPKLGVPSCSLLVQTKNTHTHTHNGQRIVGHQDQQHGVLVGWVRTPLAASQPEAAGHPYLQI